MTATQSSSGDFMKSGSREYAGVHLLIDLFGAAQLDDREHMVAALREGVAVSGATLLHLHCHHFSDSGGLSAVAVLAESHITVHTWPERQFAAFDVFMCGAAQPEKVVGVLKKYFSPQRMDVRKFLRGEMSQVAES